MLQDPKSNIDEVAQEKIILKASKQLADNLNEFLLYEINWKPSLVFIGNSSSNNFIIPFVQALAASYEELNLNQDFKRHYYSPPLLLIWVHLFYDQSHSESKFPLESHIIIFYIYSSIYIYILYRKEINQTNATNIFSKVPLEIYYQCQTEKNKYQIGTYISIAW